MQHRSAPRGRRGRLSHFWTWLERWGSRAHQGVYILIFVAPLTLIGASVLDALTRWNMLDIEPIGVPEELAHRGFTPEIVAWQLSDEIGAVQKHVRETALKLEVADTESGDQGLRIRSLEGTRSEVDEHHKEAAVAGTEGLFVRLGDWIVRAALPENWHYEITGYLSQQGQGSLTLRLRVNDKMAYSGTKKDDGGALDSLIQDGARAVLTATAGAYVHAWLLVDQGDLDGAGQVVEQIIGVNSTQRDDLVQAYNLKGLIKERQGNTGEAVAAYEKALQQNPGSAHAYSNRGNAFLQKHEYDRAIADYNESLRLDPENTAAYIGRGNAYFYTHDFDLAIADYNEVMRRDPNEPMSYNNRGNAYVQKGNEDLALADYTEAIRLDAKHTKSYFNRGLIELNRGSTTEALADIGRANELDGTYAYYALWVEIASRRANVPSSLQKAIGKVDMAKWPAPVINMYLGKITPAALLSAARDPDLATEKGQVCEANFYTGELDWAQGNMDTALILIRAAATDCPKDFLEWEVANAQLKAMNKAP